MAARKVSLFDSGTRAGRHIQRRLEKEIVIWLATSGAEGRPHAVPVWFWWDGKTFLIFSVPGQKVNDIEANPSVTMHLNTDPDGGDVVRIDGEAKRVRRHLPAYRLPHYIRKYGALIKGYGWTPEAFSSQYHVVLRVRPTRLRTG